MGNKIVLKKSSVSGKVPLAADLDYGELAINYASGKLYFKNSSNVVKDLVLTSFDGTAVIPLTGIDITTNDTANPDPRRIAWNVAEGTFDMTLLNGVTLQAGQELHYYGRAVGAIANGDAVMFAGVQGDNLLITKADATAVGFKSKWVMGIATQAIANNGWGYVTSYGKVNGLNTSGYTAGDILYLNPAVPGGLTTTMPTAPLPKITLAAVIRSANDGILLVRPTFSEKIDDVQNVNISSAANTDVLMYNSTNTRWENTALLSRTNTWSGINTFTDTFIAPGTLFVKLGLTSDQTLTSGTDATIHYSVVSDAHSWYNASTYRITPTVAGYYFVSTQAVWNMGTAGNQINTQIIRNGTTVSLSSNQVPTQSSASISSTALLYMNGTTDYIYVQAYTSSTSSHGLVGNAAWTKLEMFKLN